MNRQIYGECVQGASHIRSQIGCQDSFKKMELSEEIVLISVADGHGSKTCPYSKTGSTIAVNSFCHVMKELAESFSQNMELLPTYLNREGDTKVAKMVDMEWKRRVWKAHTDHKREKSVDEAGNLDKKAIYRQYGTTLLGLMVTSKFLFAMQIGDGDILYIDEENIQPVIQGDKILGTETHSLCKIDAWEKITTVVRIRDARAKLPYLYLLSTDGFSNSYRTQEDLYQTCREYFSMIRQYGFAAVSSNLKRWLRETSEMGCGDDITVALAYFD